MQTPKARTSSSGGAAPQRISPRSTSSQVSQKSSPQAAAAAASSEATQKVSPRVVRQLKTGPRFLEHTASSSNLATKAPKERSPKLADHRSPKSPISEKKRQSRVSELENQISQLEKDLQTVKDQLCSTEELKKQAQKDAEESNQQLAALSLKLEESRKLLETSGQDETPEEEQDQTLISELESIQKQHSHDTAALASALDEIKHLKNQLEMVAESEAAHFNNSKTEQDEIDNLKKNLSETLLLVEEMKNEVRESKEAETHAHAIVGETLSQLETAKKKVEMLRSDGLKATEEYNAIAVELDQSRAHVTSLEELVSKLRADISNNNGSKSGMTDVETEVNSVRLEVQQLRSALEAAEIRHNEEQARSAEQMEKALETVEKIRSASAQREAELESELRKSKYEIEELKANLMDKETELQGICEENESLNMKLESTLSGNDLDKEIENLKDSLTDKEREWENVTEEREKLMKETRRNGDVSDEVVVVGDVESAKAAEREALMKVGYMTEEVDKSHRKVARVAEQLEAAQAANAEMEAEMRRLKVQSDQWRKAAEAAAAMLSQGNINNGGQIMERSGSMDSHYNNSPRMGKIGSPYGDDGDDDMMMKKKNANMLRRFGVLWKKPQQK